MQGLRMQELRLAGGTVDVVAEAADAAEVVDCPPTAGGCFVILFL